MALGTSLQMEEVLEEPTSIKIMMPFCEGQTEAEKDAGSSAH